MNRLAVISIIVEDSNAAPAVNDLLHQYGAYILGRLGLPYRDRGVSVICVVIDAPSNTINSLTGALGRIQGITSKATFSSVA